MWLNSYDHIINPEDPQHDNSFGQIGNPEPMCEWHKRYSRIRNPDNPQRDSTFLAILETLRTIKLTQQLRRIWYPLEPSMWLNICVQIVNPENPQRYSTVMAKLENLNTSLYDWIIIPSLRTLSIWLNSVCLLNFDLFIDELLLLTKWFLRQSLLTLPIYS